MTQPPTGVHEIAERVRRAAAQGMPLRIRGGGSKDFHGLALQGEVLDTRGLAGVVSYEPSELVVTVRAGTPLAELEALLAAQGQCLAFEPPHFDREGTAHATVGGMVAAGLSGPARASVGAVRDFVLGLEMVNGRGELLRYGGQVMKNVAGYDVSRLMAGAWGTLGLLTELSLKVLPQAPAEATLRFECSQGQALDWLNAWGGQPLPLNASCWLQEAGARQGLLYVRLRGARAAIQAACPRMGGERLDPGTAAADWQACREQGLPWFARRAADHGLWRLSLPQTAPVLDLPHGCTEPLVEWHGALRWVQAPRHQGAALQALARAAGGSATLFRGEPGTDRGGAAIVDGQVCATTALLHQRLKHAFDPAGIFNRGRLSAAW
ncbi:MAG: glycolate oxidase subunit GlcE [Burkholderiaceae bacterium]|jgi:glycolate oxidase FAD binding subunit|nr:glycolate oxidase subunit GlcE [Burkholderiaceae bacterium]